MSYFHPKSTADDDMDTVELDRTLFPDDLHPGCLANLVIFPQHFSVKRLMNDALQRAQYIFTADDGEHFHLSKLHDKDDSRSCFTVVKVQDEREALPNSLLSMTDSDQPGKGTV
jgi:hypothetical protein